MARKCGLLYCLRKIINQLENCVPAVLNVRSNDDNELDKTGVPYQGKIKVIRM